MKSGHIPYYKDFRPGIQFVNPNDTAPELVLENILQKLNYTLAMFFPVSRGNKTNLV